MSSATNLPAIEAIVIGVSVGGARELERIAC